MNHRSTAIAPGFALLALVIALALALAPAASANIEFGGTGLGTGQLTNPQGLAVDRSNGHLYVADQGNNRVDVFDSAGAFLYAFGWGVADGTSAEPQTCTTTCFKGLAGGGAGEFTELRQIAVDNDPASPAYHDLYAFDGSRVQKFTPTGEFLRAWGGGVVTGGAKGTGDLSSGQATIANVKTTQKAFQTGQTITGAGIPANTKIIAFGPGTITLSKAAAASGTGVALTVAEGVGNVPFNEKQRLNISQTGVTFGLEFVTENPSPSSDTTAVLAAESSSASAVQSALEGLSNIEPGDVAVSGPINGPYTIEFKGRYADTDVPALRATSSGGFSKETVQSGAGAAELCTAANAADCAGGVRRCSIFSGSLCANVLGTGIGQFESVRGLAVGPGGTVDVADSREIAQGNGGEIVNRVQSFEPSGAYAAQFEPLGGLNEGAQGLALDSLGDPYVATSGALRKYDPAGNLLATLDPTSDSAETGFLGALGLDAAGSVFVTVGGGNAVEYDSAGAIQRVLYGVGAYPTPYHSAGGDLFGLSGNKVRYTAFPPPGPAVFLGTGSGGRSTEATAIGNLKATLKAALNPEGKSTTYHFQYVDQQGFEEAGYASPKAKTTAESAPVGSDFKLYPVSKEVTGLTPETTYHFRLLATNADGTSNGPDVTFKTLPPLELHGAWSTDVGVDSAILHAALDPLGIAAGGYFQYVDDATYQQSGFAAALEAPDVGGGQSPFDYGSGTGSVTRAAALYPLQPATTYHYRFLATDHCKPSEPAVLCTFTGAEHALRTFPPIGELDEGCPNQALRTGPSAALPDCRAYEMVSPLDKNGGDIVTPLNITGFQIPIFQSSLDGEALTYSSYRAFADAQSAPFVSQYLARRGPSGWSSEGISPPRGTLVGSIISETENEFTTFSPDLSSAWLFDDAEPPLAPGAVEGFANIYRRDNSTGSYEALSTVEPPHHSGEYFPYFEGASADGSHVVFMANDKLTPEARNSTAIFQLYERPGEGPLRLVSILPGGSASKVASTLGSFPGYAGSLRFTNVTHAISDDGSRIFWSASENPALGGKLYLRIDGEHTISLDESLGSGESVFWLADPQGTKAVFSHGTGLYEYDVEAEEPRFIAPGVLGVIGASDDASRIYLVSSAVLSGEEQNSAGAKAKAGADNVYLYQAGAGFTYVATLAGDDGNAFSPRPFERLSRVAPDGRHLAFVSAASLTGYDNADAASGEAATEVYRYDAQARRLDCVSCNPSGSRPAAQQPPQSYVKRYQGSGRPLAGMFPGWQNGDYAPRVLSDDGTRLFFESYDALVPRDTNGRLDLYEWEAPGAPSCTEESTAYSATNGGCVYLISTGQSPRDVTFVDASPSGEDVFFTTASSLLPQDYGLVDVYDARAGGGYPPPPNPPAACEGEACQGAPAPPNDPTPASSAFEGAGNVVEGGKGLRCRHGKVRRHGRCVAKHARRQRKHASRRAANHNRRAQR